jgi:glycosyltransferase involved in cell wall biosynthesis
VKVAVVNAQVPFTRGGADSLGEELCSQLLARGHSAELVQLPWSPVPSQRVLDELLGARLTRIAAADRVIALKFPAYCVPHEDKVVWLLHQHRELYDLWQAPEMAGNDTALGRALRDAVHRADTEELSTSRVFAISQVVSARLKHFNGVDAQVLHPPLVNGELYTPGPYGDYIFLLGRLHAFKRPSLMVEAMRYVRSKARLVVAGAAYRPEELWGLRALVARHRLQRRVTLIGEWISEARKAELYAGAAAVAVPPLDEDYGLVTIEAFAAGKPVLTCKDSGGPAYLTTDGESGYVVDPDPREIARAIDRLMEPGHAERLGRGARRRLDELDLSWDRVIAELTA